MATRGQASLMRILLRAHAERPRPTAAGRLRQREKIEALEVRVRREIPVRMHRSTKGAFSWTW
jgi:hypothetical protein